MPTVILSKTKIRRGTDAERRVVVFDQGELIYTTNTNRVFVGDGSTSGGIVAGNKVFSPTSSVGSLSSTNSEIGDIRFVNNTWYQLTATPYTNIESWGKLSLPVDSTTFSYNATNTLYINSSSLSANLINPSTVSNGLKISSGILQLDYTTKSLELSGTKISVKSSGIDEREISSSALAYGLKGGSGTKLALDVSSSFYFGTSSGNVLSLSGSNPFTLVLSDLNTSWFGKGLSASNTAIDVVYDATCLDLSASKYLTLTQYLGSSGTSSWQTYEIDKNGRVVDGTSTILQVLTGYQTATFQSLSASVISSLSSTGFIVLEAVSDTQDGKGIGRFAIPVFAI